VTSWLDEIGEIKQEIDKKMLKESPAYYVEKATRPKGGLYHNYQLQTCLWQACLNQE